MSMVCFRSLYRESLTTVLCCFSLAVWVSRVRLYQDSTFYKRPGDGPTRWHSDLNMAPLDCNDFVTAWIPLHAVPAKKEGGSPLVFASKSHRDFALNHWQDSRLRADLTGRYREKDHAPLSAGRLPTPRRPGGNTGWRSSVSFVARWRIRLCKWIRGNLATQHGQRKLLWRCEPMKTQVDVSSP